MKEIIDTRITDKWGVYWNEIETVRDFLQNFYDANSISDINIEIDGNTVSVSAPAKFDYKELIYLGSDKSNDESTIGQYGEGFKASVLNALRNWNLGVDLRIEDKNLKFYIESRMIGKTDKGVVFCEIKTAKEKIAGTQLIISNCTANIIKEFKFGFNHFYFENNPLFGSELAIAYDIMICKSNAENGGYVFYENLLRAKIELPIVILCNRAYKRIDEKINHDRDRKSFNEEVLQSLLKYIFNNFEIYLLEETISHIKDFWTGNKVLSIIANSSKRRYGVHYSYKNFHFPENYYARETYGYREKDDKELCSEVEIINKEFQNNGYTLCPSYMTRLGMRDPVSVARERIEKRNQANTDKSTRSLTPNEKHSIFVLSIFIKKLSIDLYTKFKNAKYTVGDNDHIIGELKKKREYNQQHVFLNKIFFAFEFNDALAILLHEWAHIYGGDGSRTFSDALTHFISMILKNDDILDSLKHSRMRWNEAKEKIKRERENTTNDIPFEGKNRSNFKV